MVENEFFQKYHAIHKAFDVIARFFYHVHFRSQNRFTQLSVPFHRSTKTFTKPFTKPSNRLQNWVLLQFYYLLNFYTNAEINKKYITEKLIQQKFEKKLSNRGERLSFN